MVYLPHSQHFSALVYLPWVNLHKCYSVVQKLYWFWWHSITWDQSDYHGEQWSVCSSSTMESHKETALIHRCVRVYWGDLVMLVVTANINCNYCLLFAHAIKLLIKTVCECILNYSSTLLICWLAFMHSGWWETLIVVDFCTHVFLFTSRLCPVIWVCFHELTNAIFSPATWAISAAFLVPPWPL